jgi:hypothetical protein
VNIIKPKLTVAFSYLLSTLSILILSIIGLSLVVMIVDSLTGEGPFSLETEGLSTYIGFVFFIGLSIYGIWYAKRLRTPKHVQPIPTDWSNDITVEYSISEKDYSRLVYTIAAKRPVIRYLLFVISVMIILNIIEPTNIINAYENFIFTPDLIFLLIPIAIPIWMRFAVKQAYKSSKSLHEKIAITFTKDAVKIKGQSFESSTDYKVLFKVTVLKNWMLIYVSKQVFYCIPLRSMNDDALTERIRSYVSFSIENN